MNEMDSCQESTVSVCIDGIITDFMFFEGGTNEVCDLASLTNYSQFTND